MDDLQRYLDQAAAHIDDHQPQDVPVPPYPERTAHLLITSYDGKVAQIVRDYLGQTQFRRQVLLFEAKPYDPNMNPPKSDPIGVPQAPVHAPLRTPKETESERLHHLRMWLQFLQRPMEFDDMPGDWSIQDVVRYHQEVLAKAKKEWEEENAKIPHALFPYLADKAPPTPQETQATLRAAQDALAQAEAQRQAHIQAIRAVEYAQRELVFAQIWDKSAPIAERKLQEATQRLEELQAVANNTPDAKNLGELRRAVQEAEHQAQRKIYVVFNFLADLQPRRAWINALLQHGAKFGVYAGCYPYLICDDPHFVPPTITLRNGMTETDKEAKDRLETMLENAHHFADTLLFQPYTKKPYPIFDSVDRGFRPVNLEQAVVLMHFPRCYDVEYFKNVNLADVHAFCAERDGIMLDDRTWETLEELFPNATRAVIEQAMDFMLQFWRDWVAGELGKKPVHFPDRYAPEDDRPHAPYPDNGIIGTQEQEQDLAGDLPDPPELERCVAAPPSPKRPRI